MVRIAPILKYDTAVLLLVSVVVFVFSTGQRFFSLASVTLFPVIVICMGLLSVYGVGNITKHLVDLSYGS